MRRFSNTNGFTLIELMLVVGIIGVLAAIAIPSFIGFSGRAKQSEARMLLAAVATAEEAYFVDHESYGSLTNAGFAPASTPLYYSNIMNSFTYGTTSFTVTAGANIDGDATRDLWILTNTSPQPVNNPNDIIQ